MPDLLKLLVVLFLLSGCSISDDHPRYVILKDISVVDIDHGKTIPHQTVVIRDSIFYYIGDGWDPPQGADVEMIDGTGKYLMPGLWDMHFHASWDPGSDTLLFSLLLAKGITGIRDMGGDLKILQRLKHLVTKYPQSGPRIYGPGPILDGNPPVFSDFTVPLDNTSDIPGIVDSLAKGGVDFLKVYSLLKEAELRAVAEQANVYNLPFAGHLSEYVDPEISIALGQTSVEHLNRLDVIWNSDLSRLNRISQRMLERKTWLCPTLVIYNTKVRMRDSTIHLREYNPYINPVLLAEWQASREARLSRTDDRDWKSLEQLYNQQRKLVQYLHSSGIPILAGSDFGGMPFVYPGAGLHKELLLLASSGLDNAEVLRTATMNPAKFMGLEHKLGSIGMGKVADCLILTADPLEDVRNTEKIEFTFRSGIPIRITENNPAE